MISALAVDRYGPLGQAQIDDVKRNGVTHVPSYIGRKSRGYDKAIAPSDVALYARNGLLIVSNFEGDPTHPAYFTYAQGLLDAKDAVEDAKWLDQPYGTPIYFSVDCDVQAADMNAVRAYFKGVRVGLGGLYRMGVYGGLLAVNNVSADYYWQTLAWSHGVVSKRACLYQRQVEATLGGVTVDVDSVLRADVGAWPMPVAKPTPKTPKVPPTPKTKATPPTWPNASLADIVAQLRSCGFICEAGPLENNVAFVELERRAATVTRKS